MSLNRNWRPKMAKKSELLKAIIEVLDALVTEHDPTERGHTDIEYCSCSTAQAYRILLPYLPPRKPKSKGAQCT